MSKKIYSLILFIALSGSCYCMQDDSLEALLQKNKAQMTKVKNGSYELGSEDFDKVFPLCNFSTEPRANFTVGIIENTIYDNALGEYTTLVGTGTIISKSNKASNIDVITAKHVVREKGKIEFKLAQGLVFSGSTLTSKLALYDVDKFLLHSSRDIAILSFKLNSTTLTPDSVENHTTLMKMSYDLLPTRKKATLYHYPFAVGTQRLNDGMIIEGTDTHTIPTLGGSSGAALIVDNKIVGIHSGVDQFGGGTVTIESEELRFAKHNLFVRISDLKDDLSEFVESK